MLFDLYRVIQGQCSLYYPLIAHVSVKWWAFMTQKNVKGMLIPNAFMSKGLKLDFVV